MADKEYYRHQKLDEIQRTVHHEVHKMIPTPKAQIKSMKEWAEITYI